MPNLLNFLEDSGTLFTNHHTPLISHTSVDIVTSLTGVYGDKFGVPIGNNIGIFQNGVASFPSSFTYWTDLMADGLPEMLDQRGKNAPAPWVPFTRAGCDVALFRSPISSLKIPPPTSTTCSGLILLSIRKSAREPQQGGRRFRGHRYSLRSAKRLFAPTTARPTSSRTSRAATTGLLLSSVTPMCSPRSRRAAGQGPRRQHHSGQP